jgi:hypothetical protein
VTACPPPAPVLAARPGPSGSLAPRSLPARWTDLPPGRTVTALTMAADGALVMLAEGRGVFWARGRPFGRWRWRALAAPPSGGEEGFAAPLGRRGAVLAAGRTVLVVAPDHATAAFLPPGFAARGLAVSGGGEVRLTAAPASLWRLADARGRPVLRRLGLPAAAGRPGAIAALADGGWAVVRRTAPGGRRLGTSLLLLGGGYGPRGRVVHLPALEVAAAGPWLAASGGDRAAGVTLWRPGGPAVHPRALSAAGPIGDPVAGAATGAVWAAAAARSRLEGLVLCGPPRAYRLPLPRDVVVEPGGARWERPAVTALATDGSRVAVALSDGRVGVASPGAAG